MKLVRPFAAAFLGGAVGSAARELVREAVVASGHPEFIARMVVNVLGGFLAGAYLARREADPVRMGPLEPLLAAGFLGGFTTVAGYALDASHAIDSSAWKTLAALVAVDGGVGLLAAALGHRLARPRPTPAH